MIGRQGAYGPLIHVHIWRRKTSDVTLTDEEGTMYKDVTARFCIGCPEMHPDDLEDLLGRQARAPERTEGSSEGLG